MEPHHKDVHGLLTGLAHRTPPQGWDAPPPPTKQAHAAARDCHKSLQKERAQGFCTGAKDRRNVPRLPTPSFVRVLWHHQKPTQSNDPQTYLHAALPSTEEFCVSHKQPKAPAPALNIYLFAGKRG